MKVGQSEFTRTKYSSLDGQTVVTYAEPHGFKLEARPFGLKIEGLFSVETHNELDEFAQLISEAWKDHVRLKPKLLPSGSGH